MARIITRDFADRHPEFYGIAGSPLQIIVADGASPMTRILVIDDQSDVRAMICMVLRLNHFDVHEAANAAAALKMFEPTAFDVAIVDIFLDGTSGFDLITAIRDRRPDMPVVAISGMTSFDAASRPPGPSGVVYLQKPFRPNDLIGAIEKARGAEAAAGASFVPRAAC
jgi:DNA-binding NtrC family response regulator